MPRPATYELRVGLPACDRDDGEALFAVYHHENTFDNLVNCTGYLKRLLCSLYCLNLKTVNVLLVTVLICPRSSGVLLKDNFAMKYCPKPVFTN